MERTLALETTKKVGEEVKLAGWVNTRRDHGKLVFIDLRDRSGIVQVVGGQELGDLRPEDVVEIAGTVNRRPDTLVNSKIPTGEVEVKASRVNILAKAEALPFDMGQETLNVELPTLLDWRPLTLRHPKVRKIFETQEEVMERFRKVARELNCVEIFVPTIVASATEGGAEVFTISYYGTKAYLAQSPQLFKQMMVPVYERVYTVAHAYRAEPSTTTRHLAEVVQLDIEMGFVEFEELLDCLEKVGMALVDAKAPSIPRLKLREAQEIIFKEYGRDNRREKDLTPQDEIDICKWAKAKHDSDFVTITHFPTAKRAFYTMPDPEDPEYSLSYDLLFKGLELASGSQRINDYNQLVDAIKGKGMEPKNFEMYLQAFRFGMPPEGGFSFGLERVTMQTLGLGNVREASLFPRDMERVDIRLTSTSDGKDTS